MSEEREMLQATEEEREMLQFVHYETKEVRVVAKPDKLQQYNQAFISAFMTSEEHYQDLPWYREIRDTITKEVKADTVGDANIHLKAFPKIRIKFVEKYFPEHAPKEKKPREKKPAKLSMWDI